VDPRTVGQNHCSSMASCCDSAMIKRR
jgi:hypothetical protein